MSSPSACSSCSWSTVGTTVSGTFLYLIAVAFFIGTIEPVTVLHDKLGLNDALTGWISGLDLDNAGFIIVGQFVVVWAAALAYWRPAGVEKRWAARAGRAEPAEQATPGT